MGVWVGVIVVVVVLAAGVLLVARGGKDSRAARRELRQLRKEAGRTVDTAQITARRRAMLADPVPGSSPTPGGI